LIRTALKRTFLIVFLLLIASGRALYAQDNDNDIESTDGTAMAKDVLHYINQHRREMGLPPLHLSPVLSSIARKHSVNMARGAEPFGHEGFEERIAAAWMQLHTRGAAAENIAEGVTSAKAVVNLWLGSKGHRKNIEGNYTLMGLGVATSANGTMYFTQVFLYKP
jgi:uncharacterized protein YkwD